MTVVVIMYDRRKMSRWSPDARGRLEQAAYELFLAHGYESTTVADIAMRAGLTERTFFRHYRDKREVLFSGTTAMQSTILQTIKTSTSDLSTLTLVQIAVEAMCRIMHGRQNPARERQAIIGTHTDLLERGLIKRAQLTETLTSALRDRSVPESEALLAAETGMAAFHIGYTRWLETSVETELIDLVREVFDQLKIIVRNT
jgi:AcrR family transcriptional regulator